jgi:predicted Holliday junction resolvase-like endonuclease
MTLTILIVLTLYIICNEIRVHLLHQSLQNLKTNLEKNYWTKQTIARNYGIPPAEKIEAEKKQDQVLNDSPF